MKFDISIFLANMLRKLKFNYDVTKTRGTVQYDLHTFILTSRSVPLGMENILVKRTENRKKKFYFYYFPKIVPFVR